MNKQQEARAHRDLVAVLSMTPVERREFSRMSRLVTDGIFDAVHPVLEDDESNEVTSVTEREAHTRYTANDWYGTIFDHDAHKVIARCDSPEIATKITDLLNTQESIEVTP